MQPTARGIQHHFSSFPLCRPVAPGLALALSGWMGTFPRSLSPRQGTAWMHRSTRSRIHSVPWSKAWSWLSRGGTVCAGRDQVTSCLKHLVTGAWKGTGQEVSLAGRAWSGQEHISRARCPSTVPAFIRCSVSHATTALSAAVFPASGFPYKAVAFLAAVPSASLQEPERMSLHSYTCPLLGSVLPAQQKYN